MADRYQEVKEEEMSTKYSYVRKRLYISGKISYIARMQWHEKGKKRVNSKEYPTEKQAAMAVDLFRIGKGLEPINILKRTKQ